jgi:hypothetical protein
MGADYLPLRASSDHRFIVEALRARRQLLFPRILLRPRIARAQGPECAARTLANTVHIVVH